LHASCRGRTARIQRGHSMSELRTILLAEDSPHDAEMAIDALREANLANPIVHVEDGVEALDYLLRRGRWSERPDEDLAVLLLDIKMPRMDGLEVLTELRKSDRFKALPIVVLSSSRGESDLARRWDLGVNAFVVKPVDVDEFFDAVRTLGPFWAVLDGPAKQGCGHNRVRARAAAGPLARAAGGRFPGRCRAGRVRAAQGRAGGGVPARLHRGGSRAGAARVRAAGGGVGREPARVFRRAGAGAHARV